jgi:hypothetical protein
VEAIFDAMVSSFNVERSTFKIVPAGPKVFLVFLDEVLSTRILSFNNQHPSENESFRLHFRRWTRQAFASSAVLPVLVDVLMHGIPAHAWDLSTAKQLLNPFRWIQEIHEVTRNRDDLSVFQVSVWCLPPDSLPASRDLVIVEPVVQQPGDLLRKKVLVYPVRFLVFQPETRGSSPLSPPDDLESDNPRTKRRPHGADSSNDQGPREVAASEDRGEGVFQAGPSASGILHGEDAVEADDLPTAPCSPKASMAAEIILVMVEAMLPSVPKGAFTAAAPHAGVAATSLAPFPALQGVKAMSVPQEEIAPASVTERVVTASGVHAAPSSAPVPAAPIPAND